MRSLATAAAAMLAATSSLALSTPALGANAAANDTGAEPARPSATDAAPGQDIVVTATGQSSAMSTTKSATPIIESIQSISVISREEIDLRASPTIADALAYTAGVQSEPSGIDSRTDEVSVRGFGAGGFSSNNNFVDGLRLPSGGQWTRTGFDSFAMEQIEVLKGPSGALYGQTAPGGVVNIVTKRPTDSFHAQFMLQGVGTTDLENWNYQAAADVGDRVTDTISARVVGLARYGDTQVDGVRNGRYYVSPSVTWKPDDATSWTLLGQYQRDEGGSTFQFLPATGTLYASNGQYIANDANIGEHDWNTYDRNQYLAASFFQHKFGDNLTLRNNTRYTHLNTIYRVVVLSGNTLTTCPSTITGCIAGQTVNRRAVQGVGQSDGVATDTQLEARFATGALKHTLLAGGDYFHTSWQHYRDLVTSSLVLPVLDIFNPQSRGSTGFSSNLNPQVYNETVSNQTGLYLQDQMSLGGLRVTLGGRYDWSRDDTNVLTSSRHYITNSHAFTWRAGAVYLFDNGLAPYASYSTSFQPQVSDPATNKTGAAFVPTTGQQIEAGLRYQPTRQIYLTLGLYQITQQNIVTTDPEGEICPSGSTCQVQTGEGRVRGIEFEGKGTLPWGTTVIATLTRSDGVVTKTETASLLGTKLTQLPEWMASAFVNHTIKDGPLTGLGFGGGARYTGKSYGESTNALVIPDYTLFDLFVRYDMGSSSISINGRNIANTRYVATCTAVSACYYGQGRSVTARYQVRW